MNGLILHPTGGLDKVLNPLAKDDLTEEKNPERPRRAADGRSDSWLGLGIRLVAQGNHNDLITGYILLDKRLAGELGVDQDSAGLGPFLLSPPEVFLGDGDGTGDPSRPEPLFLGYQKGFRSARVHLAEDGGHPFV